jgi:phytoene dehydrogenase-like protein
MKSIIIIGAGIAGLTAGVYARQSGFDATIYESHAIPGGASTSWRRKGYLFEGGLHWLTGSSPKAPINRLWREVGALDDTVSVYDRDPFITVELGGKTARLYRDEEKLRAHLLALSPEDEREINKLCRDIRAFKGVMAPVTDIKGVRVRHQSAPDASSLLSMLPALPRLSYYKNHTGDEIARRFKSPVIRLLLNCVAGGENNGLAIIFTLATLAAGDGGYPEGGSLAMAERIAGKFTSLGGEIRYGRLVEKVWTENGAARGVIVNGERIAVDAVIVTQDTLAAVDTLFDPLIREPWAEKMRKNTVPLLDTFIALGVEADLSDVPESLVFEAAEPLPFCGTALPVIGVNNYARYVGYAPEGCSALTCILGGDTYDYWKARRVDGTYEAEKRKLAEAFIRVLEKRLPQIAGKVAVWDVATPLTYERYLHSYKGSWMSVMGKGEATTSYPMKPAGISNVYFAGQRMMVPGGLPVALETGRRAVQYLCRDADAIFQGCV